MPTNLLGIIKDSIAIEAERNPEYVGPKYAGCIAWGWNIVDFKGRETWQTTLFENGLKSPQPLGVHVEHFDTESIDQIELWRRFLARFIACADIIQTLKVAEVFFSSKWDDAPFMSGLLPYAEKHYGLLAIDQNLSDRTIERYVEVKRNLAEVQ
jgi:hypothetical protein